MSSRRHLSKDKRLRCRSRYHNRKTEKDARGILKENETEVLSASGELAGSGLSYYRFRLAELGLAGILRIVLAFIGLLLIGCLVNYLKNSATNN